MTEKNYYTVFDLVLLFGCNDKTVRRWIDKGMPYYIGKQRGGDKYYFKLWEVESWLSQHRGRRNYIIRYFKERNKGRR